MRSWQTPATEAGTDSIRPRYYSGRAVLDEDQEDVDAVQRRYSNLAAADLRLFASTPEIPNRCIIGNSIDVRELRRLGFTVTIDEVRPPPERGPARGDFTPLAAVSLVGQVSSGKRR